MFNRVGGNLAKPWLWFIDLSRELNHFHLTLSLNWPISYWKCMMTRFLSTIIINYFWVMKQSTVVELIE
jgi:hypothetical protein